MGVEVILNEEIKIHKYKIQDSKFNSSKCLHLQISWKDKMYVLFIGSNVLIKYIEKIPEDSFPLDVVIVKENGCYLFT